MKRLILLFAAAALLFAGCTPKQESPDWTKSVVYELNTRQFTPEGTLAAAQAQLPRLKEMGVDIVWLMPIYPIGEKGRKGTLGSYYAIRDYCDINPEFGTIEDFDAFVAEAHRLGLRVIIDWVANHTSPDHPWVSEKAADWYVRDEQGNTIVEYDWTDIAKLNYGCADMRTAMKECMLFWLGHGIDGLRCDMASLVPEDFWADAISTMRVSTRKPLYFLAEGEDPWLHRAGFDATYAWKLHHLLNDIAQGKAELSAIDEYLQWNKENFPEGAVRLGFTSNHDENSWAGTEFERMGDKWMEMTDLLWSLPGHQMLLYTGQEFGWNHRFQFFEKDSMPEQNANSYTEYYRNLIFGRHCNGAITRIEPLNWWVGMKTPLQLLIQGENIGECSVSVRNGRGVRVTGVHTADSPNYLFVDVKISRCAKPGTRELVFTAADGRTFSVPYELRSREKGSADRTSFTSADLMYLIMPDRFVNGDPRNDSTPQTLEKAAPSEFYGRHGGDIAGIASQLDYLADLGVTAIWNTPLLEDNQPHESYHGYACTDYYHIDSRFGSNEEYRALVDAAHAKGIKMVMDIVTNHCGSMHWWMEDLPFEDWIHTWPEYTHSNCCFSVQNDPYAAAIDRANMEGGWFDRSMADMNLDNPYVLRYFQQWAVWWIEWAGLDGLRVDTYPYNEKVPMSKWCAAVRNEYPAINIVGEVWTDNVPQLAYWQDGNPNKDGFNSNLPAVMDFPLHTAMCRALNYNGKVNWDEGMVKIYDCVANDQYYQNKDNMLIFPGNHDIDRIADILGDDPSRVKLAFTLTATLRGIPQVLYAEELKANSKDLRQGHGGLRIDFPLDWESNATAVDMHDYFKTLFNWRKGSLAVQKGDLKHYLRRDNTYAYFRSYEDETVFVYINNNDHEVSIPWADYAEANKGATCGKDVISGQNIDFTSNVTIAPKSSLIVEL